MKLLGQNSGYKLLKKNEDTAIRTPNRILRSGLVFASEFASYALLPIILLLYFDLIYNYYLQYALWVLTVVFLIGILYKVQDRLLYHPEMPPHSSFYVPFPTHTQYEIVTLKTDDGEQLHGFFIRTSMVDYTIAPTIIYFHGNAGNCGSPCVLPLTNFGSNVLIMDYRGYGKSTGTPSEHGVYLDGKACIDYVSTRNDIDPNKIVLFGHSMGGAVAVHLAAIAQEQNFRIAALILANTFTTLPNAAKHIFRGVLPGLSKLPLMFYSNKFLSIEKMDAIRIPTLFIVGEKDEIVPSDMMRVLYNAASNNPHRILLRVPNGSHNDTWCASKNYNRLIHLFLAKVFNTDHGDMSMHMDDLNFIQRDPNPQSGLTWNSEIIAS